MKSPVYIKYVYTKVNFLKVGFCIEFLWDYFQIRLGRRHFSLMWGWNS